MAYHSQSATTHQMVSDARRPTCQTNCWPKQRWLCRKLNILPQIVIKSVEKKGWYYFFYGNQIKRETKISAKIINKIRCKIFKLLKASRFLQEILKIKRFLFIIQVRAVIKIQLEAKYFTYKIFYEVDFLFVGNINILGNHKYYVNNLK